jgi:DNA uptake protein ComE-like DNA-binding protein
MAVDLNTAEIEHLEALGLGRVAGNRILAARDKDGLFAHLDDIIDRAKLAPKAGRQLKAMSAAAHKAGPFRRE